MMPSELAEPGDAALRFWTLLNSANDIMATTQALFNGILVQVTELYDGGERKVIYGVVRFLQTNFYIVDLMH
jgi:hypothetical protein